MKLHEAYPNSIEADGRVYRLNTGFKRVLRSTELLGDARLHPDVRRWAALREIIRGKLPKDPEKQARLLEVAQRLFFPPGKPGKSTINLEQDADLIRAAFLQVYRIDLAQKDIGWFCFCELLSNIPAGTRLADVIDIRTRPMPKPTKHNAEERQRLLAAKAAVAIQLSPEEETASRKKSAAAFARALMSMARK